MSTSVSTSTGTNGARPPAQIVQLPVLPEVARERGMSPAQWNTMRQVFYPAAQSDDIVALVWDYCKARGLDPMLKPFHVVAVWDAKQRKMVDSIWPSIANYRITAHRTGAYAGMSAPELGPDITLDFKDKDGNPVKVSGVPEWGSITVYRLVGGEARPFPVKLWWSETYAKGGGTAPTPMWIKRPKGQFLKCLESAALRVAFPEIGPEPTAEEMEGRAINEDYIDVTPTKTAEPGKSQRGAQARAVAEKRSKAKEPAPETTSSDEPPAHVLEGAPPEAHDAGEDPAPERVPYDVLIPGANGEAEGPGIECGEATPYLSTVMGQVKLMREVYRFDAIVRVNAKAIAQARAEAPENIVELYDQFMANARKKLESAKKA